MEKHRQIAVSILVNNLRVVRLQNVIYLLLCGHGCVSDCMRVFVCVIYFFKNKKEQADSFELTVEIK